MVLRFERSLWFRPSLAVLAAGASLAIAPLLNPYVPPALTTRIGEDDLEAVLSILSSSMLAVAIFSLGTMVSALQGAAGSATPRTRPLLSADRTAQTAISSFIGAFVFSVVGIIALRLGLIEPAGRVVLLALALLVIVLVLAVLVAWIERLSRMGGVGEVIGLVGRTATEAFAAHARDPFGGGAPAVAVPENATPVLAEAFGAVQLVDHAALGRLTESAGLTVHVVRRAGARVHPGRVLAWVEGSTDPAHLRTVRSAFVIGAARSFEQDPRFGLVVLAEIAARALSPAVNDPGTAIDVIAAQTRLLGHWRQTAARQPLSIKFPRLFVPPLDAGDLMADAFRPIARDGAGTVEVGMALQNALTALCALDGPAFGPAARAMSAEALDRAAEALSYPADRTALRARAPGDRP